MRKEREQKQEWVTIEFPGYLGSSKDVYSGCWDRDYGRSNWRIVWELSNREILNFEQIFQHYVESYSKFFENNPVDALFLTNNFAYAYDKDKITKKEAFNQFALYNQPGRANQFHHVALNFALELYLGLEFKGLEPIQVREGKPGTDSNTWPAGWHWSPGRIPSAHPELIPLRVGGAKWWQAGSIEDLYQSAKILQIKK